MTYRPQLLSIDGLLFEVFSNTQANLFSGIARDSTNRYDIATNATITIDITVNGANGLDVGAKALNTWYALHVIDGPGVAVAGLFSLSPSAPTLPAGYTVFRRIGWARTSGSNNLRSGLNIGNGNQREYWYNNSQLNLAVLVNGSQNGGFAAVACSNFMPPTSQLAQFSAFQDTANVPTIDAQTRPNGFTGAAAGVAVTPGLGTAGALPRNYFYMGTDDQQQIQYENSAAGGTTDLFVISYVDEV